MSTDLRQISEREREILRLVAAGLTNQQIANQLGVSVNTIKVHLRNVFSKIGVTSRTEATMYAVRAGIVTVEPSTASPLPDQDIADLDLPLRDPLPSQEEVEEVASDTTTPVPAEPLADTPERNLPATKASASRRLWPLALGAVVVALALLVGAMVLAPRLRGSNALPADGDVQRARWTTLAPMPEPRAGFAVANAGNLIYVIGGESSEGVLDSVARFDSRFGSWTTLSAKPTSVTDVRTVVLGGKLYVPGGRRSTDQRDVARTLESYDPRTDTWERLADLPAPRSGYALAALEGKLYLFGGWDGSAFRAEVFEYDPETEVWSERAPLPSPRAFGDAGVVADGIYVMGGENETGALRDNFLYTPAQDTAGSQPWTRRAPLPEARHRFGAVAVLANLYVLGGSADDRSLLRYNTRTDTWETLAAPPLEIGAQPGIVLLDETIISLGGKTSDDAFSTVAQSYQALFTLHAPIQ